MLEALEQALNSVLLGKASVVKLALSCLLAKGHLLLEDLPGMGKTTLSQALAHLTGMQYQRIQFTSDLLPSDLLGVSIFDSQNQSFQFHQGPIFAQVILADEINRASPKTQSALLEAMEEGQVTVEHETYALPDPFFVIATQNPMHQTGIYPLPESQLDRFLMRLSIGYPDANAERLLLVGGEQRQILTQMPPAIEKAQLCQLQQQVCQVTCSEVVVDYVQSLLAASRTENWFNHGLSPRAGRAIIKAAQAYALIDERHFVRAEDVQAILGAVIDHRLTMSNAQGELSPAHRLLNHVEVPV